MSDIAGLLNQAMPAVGAAVASYGVAVLHQAESDAAQATVRLGQRLLGRVMGHAADPAPVEAAVAELSAAAEDPDALAALRLQLRKVLRESPSLAEEWAELLPERPDVRAEGDRSIAVGGDQRGIVSTGDGATNIQIR